MLPDKSVIDTAALTGLGEFCDIDVLRKLVDTFLNQAPNQMASARIHLKRREMAEAARAIHTLRSGIGTLGAKEMDPLARSFETLATEDEIGKHVDELAAILDNLETAFSAAAAELQALMATPDRFMPA